MFMRRSELHFLIFRPPKQNKNKKCLQNRPTKTMAGPNRRRRNRSTRTCKTASARRQTMKKSRKRDEYSSDESSSDESSSEESGSDSGSDESKLCESAEESVDGASDDEEDRGAIASKDGNSEKTIRRMAMLHDLQVDLDCCADCDAAQALVMSQIVNCRPRGEHERSCDHNSRPFLGLITSRKFSQLLPSGAQKLVRETNATFCRKMVQVPTKERQPKDTGLPSKGPSV